MNEGLPFKGFTEEESSRITLFISDVDDTITTDGKLYPETLRSLWRLKRSGRMVVLLTGGSCGWADTYIRQWPVDAVIAESGAVLLCYGKDGKIKYTNNPEIDKEVVKKKASLLKVTSGLTLSSDQYARMFDVAYDKSKLEASEKRALGQLVKSLGGTCYESSIHINVAFGKYSKEQAVRYFLPKYYSYTAGDVLEKGIFLGDSLNDEPMFGYMPFSVGMHSVEDMRAMFKYLPRYITEGYSGEGFTEVVRALLAPNPA